MYYIVNETDGCIVYTTHSRPTEAKLQKIANDMDRTVYVIRGEHAGMTATPQYDDGDDSQVEDEG